MKNSVPQVILLLTLLAGLSLSAKVTNPKKVPRNAVHLTKVSALTLRAGKQTTSRRGPPVPQLQCVGPAEICKLYAVDSMRCVNEGTDYDELNVQWSCKASLPAEFKLGSTEVGCEGYESSEDPYVLSGSCGVEYRLLLTEKGEEKYGHLMKPSWPFGFNSKSHHPPRVNKAEKYAGYLFMAVFLAVLFIILRAFYNAWRQESARRPPRPRGGGGSGFWGGGGGGGGGGGDDGNDPPPPYTPRQPPRPKKPSSTASSSGDRTNGQEQGWRPGFWSGTAAGAAAGYMAGTYNRDRAQERAQPRNTGGWFGGGGPSRSSGSSSYASSSSSTPSYGSARHESTGFGGTRRR